MWRIKTMDFTPKAKLSLNPSYIFLNITSGIHPYLNRNFLPPTQPLAVITSAYLSFWDSHAFQISLLEKINIESNYWGSQGGLQHTYSSGIYSFSGFYCSLNTLGEQAKVKTWEKDKDWWWRKDSDSPCRPELKLPTQTSVCCRQTPSHRPTLAQSL